MVITADEAVREAIATVFRRFDELGSARQVLLSLREDGLLLPRRPATAPRRITWAPATYPAVHDFLTNPAYAGAFVFGRTRTEKRIDPAGRVHRPDVRLLPREQWEVLIPDHHPGFISWETYEANTARLRANWRPPRGLGGGAAREGRALLQGLLRCGRCGRIMQTGYSGPKGNCPRYVCARAKQLYAGEHGCQSIGGGRLEKRGPGRGVRRARTGGADRDRPGAGRGRQPPSARPGACSSWPSNGPATKPTGRGASSTPSSRRTGWSPAPWNERWKTSWPRPRTPRTTWPPSRPAARSR